MAVQVIPNNVPNCLATLLSLVDDICYHSGDRSVDVSKKNPFIHQFKKHKKNSFFGFTRRRHDVPHLGDMMIRNKGGKRLRDAKIGKAAVDSKPLMIMNR